MNEKDAWADEESKYEQLVNHKSEGVDWAIKKLGVESTPTSSMPTLLGLKKSMGWRGG